MSTYEHLIQLQGQQDIAVGDTVLVFPFRSYINGNPFFNPKMAAFNQGTVKSVRMEGWYSVNCPDSSQEFVWPSTHVTLLKKKETKKVVRLNSQYTADVYADKVVVGCQTFTIERLREILDVATELGKQS